MSKGQDAQQEREVYWSRVLKKNIEFSAILTPEAIDTIIKKRYATLLETPEVKERMLRENNG